MRYRIAYDEPGRLRVRFGPDAFTQEQGYGIAALLLGRPGVREAVTCALNGSVLVCYGDMPLMRRATYESLIETHKREGNDCTLLSSVSDEELPYGRIVRKSDGSFSRRVDKILVKSSSRFARNAKECLKAIRELNVGVYVFESGPLWEAIDQLRPNNAQGEYYLTDAPAYILSRGGRVGACPTCTAEEMLGVNTVEREGISYSHPARFILVGTMNPEEGDLRPQLLDRFGLMVEVRGEQEAEARKEVVRRRLFLDCKDPEARDRVCTAFSQMYQNNPGDFPADTKEVDYRDRMISCYPIHPEIFDRLYDDWSTLERFQRTRGVLRLMAAVIHELWMGSDASAMILPGSISLDAPNVRDELIRYLPEGWNSIVNTEIDGKNSVPYQKDQSNQRYGRIMASRRVARTIMLGSAPTVRSQSVRGIEASRIRLGVVQPGENIADFNDALNTLRGSLAYLYTNTSGDQNRAGPCNTGGGSRRGRRN